MKFSTAQTLASRLKALGESASADGFEELITNCRSEAALVRRAAASAIGKLAGIADAATAVATLASMLNDTHPQVRQYAAKALSAYGAEAESVLPALRDLYRNPTEKDYVKRTVKAAGILIKEAIAIAAKDEVHTCMRCGRVVEADEYALSQRFFQRTLCNICFDQTATQRRNFETSVEDKKRIRTLKGTLVQSRGEQRIAEWLERQSIPYRYDARLRIIEGFQIRPDFYLPEHDIYIEYWGLDTPRYKAGMHLKQDLYMHTGKKLISLYPADISHLDTLLPKKLKALTQGPPPQ